MCEADFSHFSRSNHPLLVLVYVLLIGSLLDTEPLRLLQVHARWQNLTKILKSHCPKYMCYVK